MKQKQKEQRIIHILGGGTINHIRSHFAIAAMAYGGTAKILHALFKKQGLESQLHLTKMATGGASKIETNDNVKALVDVLLKDTNSKVIIFNVAIADFKAQMGDIPSGKYAKRLRSREVNGQNIALEMADKVIPDIKLTRPDILLVGFKTTTFESEETQIERAKQLLNSSKADFVIANDTGSRINILLSSDGSILAKNKDRMKILEMLVTKICDIEHKKRHSPSTLKKREQSQPS